ncbi:hypothetical protein BASA83_009115 [Batrachochytrium salamandrivorans]|nr:hypothetical protein BASA83_009115 [Batrachochytrium salamandrivorans]
MKPHLPAENNSNEPPLLAENNSDEPPLPADNNSNEPSSSQPNPADANEQSESSQSTSFTSRMFSHITGLLARIRDFYMDGEYSNIIVYGGAVGHQVTSRTGREERYKDKKADYTSGYNMIQKAAIKRSRDYLQELTNIGECMMKAWGTMPKAFTFKNRDGLLESLLEVDEFKTVGENALIWDPDNPKKGRKGRKDLVTSKEILDAKDYSFHNSAISEDGDYCYDCYEYYRDDEEEEEEKDEEDEEEEEKDEEEEEDDEKEEYEEYEEYEDEEQMIKIELFMSNLIRSKNS